MYLSGLEPGYTSLIVHISSQRYITSIDLAIKCKAAAEVRKDSKSQMKDLGFNKSFLKLNMRIILKLRPD